jgi:hypothetical protein
MENNIIDKIRNLLAMAEHPNSNEHEAAIALGKAQKLLLEHNLVRADVVADGSVDTTPQGIGQIDGMEMHGFNWKSRILNTIALNTLCKVITSAHEHKWHLFGTYTNVRGTLEMYNWIVPELERIAPTEWAKYKKSNGPESSRTWKAGFFYGATISVRDRLRQPMADFAMGNGRDLVVQNAGDLKKAVDKVYPYVSSRRTSVPGSYDGYQSGKASGATMRLSRQKSMSGGSLALGAGR